MPANQNFEANLIYPQGLSFLGTSFGFTKTLAGFQKSHKLPDKITAATQNFVARIGAEEVRETANSLFAKMRQHLGYKRKDISASDEPGLYVIQTPDFILNVSIEIDPSNLSRYLLITELTAISNPELITSDAFAEVFNRSFDAVNIDFPDEVPVEDIIDRIEDYEDQSAVHVDYPPDATSCTIRFKGFDAPIRLDQTSLELSFIDKHHISDIVKACRNMSCFFSPEE